MSMNGTLPTPEDIKRVKGLGFLHDKTTADCFNARVITRNGRLQPDEIRAIVDAAEKFGSGEIAMTTRLTIEVQRIPFANIEPPSSRSTVLRPAAPARRFAPSSPARARPASTV